MKKINKNMLDITMDITTSATVLASLATVLGFFWTIIHNHRKKQDDDDASININDSHLTVIQAHEEDIDILSNRVADLEKSVSNIDVKLETLAALAQVATDENVRIRQELLDNLDRIENRLEKMIDLILRLKHDE